MAYAAVISLKNTIHRLKNLINIPQIRKSLHEELDCLRSVLKRLDDESSRMVDRSVINEVDAKIRDAIWKLEDVLESYVLASQGDGENSCSGSSKKKKRKKEKSCCLVPLVDEIEMAMDSFLKTVKLLREEYNSVLQNPSRYTNLSAAVPPVNDSTTVRLSDLSRNIINGLLSNTFNPFTYDLVPDPHFVSLVGMAGIGKTHLAVQIYRHPHIVRYFHVRLWVRAGPKYQLKVIYLDILFQLLRMPRDLFKEDSEDTLRDLIKSILRPTGRYLIVLDDIWYPEVVNHIKSLITGRFLLTTRDQELATGYGYRKATIHQMPFLNNEESWDLLWQNVFVAENSFPPQLEKPGRKIAEECEGLPLLILKVAIILRGLEKTEEYWEKVAERKTTTFTEAYDQIYEVLLPSYEYLPQHLKACFLYMGVFPRRFEIPFSKLRNLWTVEDILDPTLIRQLARFEKYTNQQEKLKKFAIKCMEDLVSKSLVMFYKQRFEQYYECNKSSKLHSAYWYLCVKEARKSKFFHALNKLTDVSIETQRRLAVQNNILLGLKEVYGVIMAAATSTTRSLLCTGEDHQYPVQICFVNTMLLMRVLDALAIRFYEFPNEVLKLLQLKYLSLTHNGELPSSINKLQQLQFLILRQHHNIKFPTTPRACLPEEIWDMQELRHLSIMGSNLPDPIKGAQLPKLLRLYVNANSCTKAVFKRIRNLEKLGIKIELEPDAAAETVRCLEHVGVLNRLDSLKCVVVNPRLQSELIVAPPDHLSNLPWGLCKLSLSGLGYSWKYMSVIGSLPSLRVLKLRCCAFQGAEWETEAPQFDFLEYLLLEDIDLVHWTCKDTTTFFYGCKDTYDELVGPDYNGCFLRLKHLIVRHCYKLKKIPHIRSLEMVEVEDCSPSVEASALQIKEKIEKKQEGTIKSFDFQLIINSTLK